MSLRVKKELRVRADSVALGDSIVWGGAVDQAANVVELDPDHPGHFRIEWRSVNDTQQSDWVAWGPADDVNVWR